MNTGKDTTHTIATNHTAKNRLMFVGKCALTFVILVIAELSLLTIAASIPRDAIQSNMEESALYLSEQRLFPHMVEGDYSSRTDNYADSILLNIAYSYDSSSPLYSALESAYYYTNTQNENQNLLDAVTGELEANHSYARYWHGGAAVVRFLSLCFNLQQIYVVSYVVLAFLLVWLLYLLAKYKKHLILPITLSLVAVSIWYVPLCLEYTWNFMLLAISCALTIIIYQRKSHWLPFLYFIIGSLTAYMDFLTTETLVCLYPIVLLISMYYEDGAFKTQTKVKFYLTTALRYIIPWGIGYVATWASKWILASIVTGSNVITDAINQSAYRIAGDSEQAEGILQVMSAPLRNMQCLFPISFIEKNGHIVFVGIIILL